MWYILIRKVHTKGNNTPNVCIVLYVRTYVRIRK